MLTPVLLRKSLRDLTRRPLRTILTLVGVVLGVAGVVAISFAGRNLADAQRATYAGTSQPDITAFADQLPPSVVDLIARRDDVLEAESFAVQYTRASVGTGWLNTRLIGIDDVEHASLAPPELIEGRFPQHGEIAFDVTARGLTPMNIGDVVAVQDTAGAPIFYAHVSGFVRAPATPSAALLNQATAYMTGSEVRQILGRPYNNALQIRVGNRAQADQTASEVRRLLERRGIESWGYAVRDPENFTGSRELATLLLLLRVFSVLGAILSTFLVANTVTAVMVEETRQVGILKALGASRRVVLGTYVSFAGLIGLAGGVIGWAIGLVAGQRLSTYLAGIAGLSLPAFVLSLREVGLAILVGLAVTITAALIPAWSAARRPVARLLANAGVVSDYRHNAIQRMTAPIGRISSIAAIGLRNLTRRPARSAISLSVVAVAVAAFLGTQAVGQSVNATIDHLYGIYGADGWIAPAQPTSPEFARTLLKEPGVTQAEAWSSASGSIGSTRTDIWGMPVDTDIYTPQIIAGHWLDLVNPTGAVVSSNLAADTGARVGDTLTLDVGNRSTLIQVLGIVNDESTYLGATTTGKVFLRTQDLQAILGREGRASLFAVTFNNHAPAAVDAALGRLETDFASLRPVTLAKHDDQASASRITAILTIMLDVVVIVVAAVGLAGIVNTLVINLAERRRELGVLRAVGASASHIVRLVTVEALALTMAGIVLGLVAGYPLARALVTLTGQQLFELDFTLGPATVLLAGGVGLLGAIAASTGPGLIASRVRPIEVLRYE